MPPLKSPLDKVKKPRHRHSAVQLAALNNLFDQTEHPTLIQRTELAQSLGLETKSINAFFQNKRASLKKLPRGSPYGRPHPSPYSSIDDDYFYPPINDGVGQNQYFRSAAPHLDQDPRQYPPDHNQFLSESASERLSRLQVDELQRFYRLNPYPTPEETKAIAEQLAMRHQTISEWFRTQRSLDRRSNLGPDYPVASESVSPISEAGERLSRVYNTLPPISALPPASSHPSLVGIDGTRPRPEDPHSRPSRRSASPRNPTPYGSTSTTLSLSARQRRGRPDPVQLNSLRGLLSKTPTPSIEERSALALEIGMDLGKVTNWFRNLRQSARKRAKKAGGGAHAGTGAGGSDDDYEGEGSEAVYLSSTSRSRSETPRMSSVERDNDGYVRGRRRRRVHSSDDEEEAQEAVTPSSSPSPGPTRPPDLVVHLEQKQAAQFSAVPYEDALLLLGFHRHAGERILAWS
ncbi:homeodomain transcription factor [Mycena galericulata]|nr:homeodomain transcription factor [Mycena galericulata]